MDKRSDIKRLVKVKDDKIFHDNILQEYLFLSLPLQ